MSTGHAKHSSNLEAKVAHRVGALERIADTGTIYVPFCGFGECADAADYPMHRVVGCDIDAAAAEHWHEHWPDADITCADATKFADWGDAEIVLADIDSYGAPYKALEWCLRNAPLAKTVQALLTDGSDQKRTRGKRPYNFTTHKFEAMHSVQAAEQQADMETHIVGWLDTLGWDAEVVATDASGASVVRYYWLELTRRPDAVSDRDAEPIPGTQRSLAAEWLAEHLSNPFEMVRGHRVVASTIFEPPDFSLPIDPITGRQTKCTAETQAIICRMISEEGATLEVAASEAGVSPRTVRDWIAKGRAHTHGVYRRFVDAYDAAMSRWHRRAIATISQAGFGLLPKTRTKVKHTPDGTEVEVVTETHHDIKALQWLLAHRFPELYSDRVLTEANIHLHEHRDDHVLRIEFVDPPDFADDDDSIIDAEVVDDPPALTATQ